jgi:hypothetical protein
MTPAPEPALFTGEDVAAAAEVLRGAADGEPELLLVLTDEQIAGLDGADRPQFGAAPWLGERPEQREAAAEAGLRALLAADRVREVSDPAGGRRRWQAEPTIAGCLLLRRTAPTFTTAERTVQTPQGPEVQRLHHYVHPDGVLEEEVTPSGLHRFTPLRVEQAAARLAVVVDRDGVAGTSAGGSSADGTAEPVSVRGSELASGHPLAARLAAARSLVVLTAVRAEDGAVRQVSVAAAEDEVLLMEAEGPAAEDPPLRVRALDADQVRDLAVELLDRG